VPNASAPHDSRLGQTVRYRTTHDGVRIAYACTGAGPSLVKAANWLNHLELDWHSPLWGLLIRERSERHQLVRYDERGNGLSQWDVEDLSFDAFVRDLEVVVDGLGLERFPLIGVSQGCAVSIEYAARHPERVSALILIGGYASGWRIWGDSRTVAEREATMTLVRHGWGQDNPAYRQIFSHSFFPGGNAGELDWFNEFQRRTASAENAVRFLEVFSTIDVRHRLPDIVARTLVIHSRGDQRVALEQGVALASGIANSELVTLDSDSHLPLDREPAHAAMLACIHRFLAQ
jgi:pimeloyl-ACP methyl ester carboxylesterase